MQVYSQENHLFQWSIFQHAVFDHRRVTLLQIRRLTPYTLHLLQVKSACAVVILEVNHDVWQTHIYMLYSIPV